MMLKRFALPAIVFVLAVCGGLARVVDQAGSSIEDKKEQPKGQQGRPDFEPIKLSILPQRVEKGEANLRAVKPGHWAAAMLETKANNFDFVGRLDAEVKLSALGSPVDLPGTPFQLLVTRPAPLPKGQPKFLEMPLFVPGQSPSAWLVTDLLNRGGSLQATPGPEPLALMKPYQYFLIVLAGEPDRYRPLESLDSIHAPHGGDALNYYRVMAPQIKKPLPLPGSALAWSSIADVIWDDVDPQMLTPEQQQAMLDWLQQGGQLIISGPKSLDQLGEQTFLHSYLPAIGGEPIRIGTEELKELNKNWTLPVKRQPGKTLSPVNEWNGVTLQLQAGAEFVAGTGDLIANRRVGRGRIVVTAFRLSERELWNWPSFDGIVNACLLLRPERRFSTAGTFGDLSSEWADGTRRWYDPRWVTGVRYLARDWSKKWGFGTSEDAKIELNPRATSVTSLEASEAPVVSDEEINALSVGGWNDFNDVANAARDTLRDAAGLMIPKARFVIGAIAVYLIVLVPLNWLVFWAIGRVEWAWIAAPLIALVSMAVVVRMAQLDIGFARSQTEIGVLELHDGYPRGYLSRYIALYTSLSTTYDVNAADMDTAILPFSTDPGFRLLLGQANSVVTFRNDPEVQLAGYAVSSNATGMLHCEQMIDLGGGIELVETAGGDGEVRNHSTLALERVAVIRKTKDEEYQVARVGNIAPGGAANLNFRSEDARGVGAEWSFDMVEVNNKTGPRLNLDSLANLVRGKKQLRAGEVRLVGLVARPLPGLKVDPAASQEPRGATLVVAFLHEAPLAEPQRDANTRRDIVGERGDKPFEDEMQPETQSNE